MMKASAILAVCLVATGCAPGQQSTATEDDTVVPDGPLSDLVLDGVDADGNEARIALADYHDPKSDKLLMVVVAGGTWCGTSQWLVDGASPWLDGDLSRNIDRLDLVASDRDNAPAGFDAAADWQRRADDELTEVSVGADPSHQLATRVSRRQAQLPLFVLVDERSLEVIDTLANPSPRALRQRLGAILGHPEEPLPDEVLVDGLFTEHEWALLLGVSVPDTPPPAPSNGVADDPLAADLGKMVFFDSGLSPSGEVACASCHQPDKQFGDGLALAQGVSTGTRRTPAIALAAHARWQFWDGRADTLWAQALGPFEAESEMGSSREFVVERVLSEHRAAYDAAFPNNDLPQPATIEWSAMLDDGERVTRVFTNIGKSIAAWERTLRVLPNALDNYLAGDMTALNASEKYGLQLFVSQGCMQCHWGPRLTNDAFHNVGVPGADAGRSAGIAAWLTSEFRSDGHYSDAPLQGRTASTAAPLGQFKTPPLRGIADAAFFGHNGSMSSLEEVTEFYGWLPSDSSREPWVVPFSETAQWGLVPFLRLLTAQTKTDSGSPSE